MDNMTEKNLVKAKSISKSLTVASVTSIVVTLVITCPALEILDKNVILKVFNFLPVESILSLVGLHFWTKYEYKLREKKRR